MMTNKSLPMPITVRPYHHQQQAFDFACMRFGLLPSDFRSNGVPKLVEAENRALLVVAESRICYNADRLWFCRSLFCMERREDCAWHEKAGSIRL